MKLSKSLLFGFILLTTNSCYTIVDKSGTLDTYVIVVAFDGFRWDYTDLYETPNFDNLASLGVKAERLIPSFPTKTFPNHYSIATGLYPDNHGIISNSFYAADLNGVYRIGDMHTIFYAEGPAFKNGYTNPAFPNVDIYGIITHILGLDPADNDGELDRVSEMFSKE